MEAMKLRHRIWKWIDKEILSCFGGEWTEEDEQKANLGYEVR